MNKLRPILLVLTAVAALSVAYPARANFIETINQVGTNVVAAGSGTIDLAGLSFEGNGTSVGAGIIPNQGQLNLNSGLISFYGAISGPTSFGSGGITFANSSSGDAVGILGLGFGWLFVPRGYLSGNPLSATSTYNGATFASLGLTPGTYEWTWGTGADAGSFTLQIGTVPDGGTTVMLLGAALGALGMARRFLKA